MNAHEQTVEAYVIAIATVRLMKEIQKGDAEKLLFSHWMDIRRHITGEGGMKWDLGTSFIILDAYFCKSGNWNEMEDDMTDELTKFIPLKQLVKDTEHVYKRLKKTYDHRHMFRSTQQ